MDRFDLVVIGCGPAGEKGAAQAAYFGKAPLVNIGVVQPEQGKDQNPKRRQGQEYVEVRFATDGVSDRRGALRTDNKGAGECCHKR